MPGTREKTSVVATHSHNSDVVDLTSAMGELPKRRVAYVEPIVPVNSEENFLQTDRAAYPSMEDIETLSGDLDTHLSISSEATQDKPEDAAPAATTVSVSELVSSALGMQTIVPGEAYNSAPFIAHRSHPIYSPPYSVQTAYSPSHSDLIGRSPVYEQNLFSPKQADIPSYSDLVNKMNTINTVSTYSTGNVLPDNRLLNNQSTLAYSTAGTPHAGGTSGIVDTTLGSKLVQFTNSDVQNTIDNWTTSGYDINCYPTNANATPFLNYTLQTDGFTVTGDNVTATNQPASSDHPNIGHKRVRQRPVKPPAVTNDATLDLTSLTEIEQVIKSDSFSSYGRDKKMVCPSERDAINAIQIAPNGLPNFETYQPPTAVDLNFMQQNFPTDHGNFPLQLLADYSMSQRNFPTTTGKLPQQNNFPVGLTGIQLNQHQLFTTPTPSHATTVAPLLTTATPLSFVQPIDVSTNRTIPLSMAESDDCFVVASYPGQPSVETIKAENNQHYGEMPPVSRPVGPASSATDTSNCYDRLSNVQDEDGGKIFHYLVEFYEKLFSDGNRTGATKLLPLTLTYLNHPSLRPLLHHRDINWQTPLHLAVEKNLSRLVTVFLHYGADVNTFAKRHSVTGVSFQTPLHIAVSLGDVAVKIVELLLATNRLDINKRNSDGETALHLACKIHGTRSERGERIICNHIIQHLMQSMESESEFNAKEYKTGRTPLMLAVITKDISFIEEFLAHIDDTILHSVMVHHDNYNNTCMHYAGGLKGLAMKDHAAIVWRLLSRGGDADTVNKNKETARSLAEKVFEKAISWMQGK